MCGPVAGCGRVIYSRDAASQSIDQRTRSPSGRRHLLVILIPKRLRNSKRDCLTSFAVVARPKVGVLSMRNPCVYTTITVLSTRVRQFSCTVEVALILYFQKLDSKSIHCSKKQRTAVVRDSQNLLFRGFSRQNVGKGLDAFSPSSTCEP